MIQDYDQKENLKDEYYYKELDKNDEIFLQSCQIHEIEQLKLKANQQESCMNSTWQFYNEYISFFNQIRVSSFSIRQILQKLQTSDAARQQLEEKLKKNKFFIMRNKSSNSVQANNEVKIKVTCQTKNYDIVQVICQIGRFTKKYIVLNNKQSSLRHGNQVVGMGSFGKIYFCHHSNFHEKSVVKCLKYSQDQIEFIICDLASALQIGPKILKKNRFNFILFPQCLEFQMERCQPLKYQTLKMDLQQNLLTIHLLGIVHSDIKPSNIMYSPVYKKNVFIDFGVSLILQQRFGFKKVTSFQGTYQFCGQEMKKIFMKNKNFLIDLYKNDVQSLEKSLKYIQQNKGQLSFSKLSKINEQKCHNQIPMQYIYEFKYHLYVNQYNKVPTKQLGYFWKHLNQLKGQKLKSVLLKEAQIFAAGLGQFSLVHLRHLTRWKIIEKLFIAQSPDGIKVVKGIQSSVSSQQSPFFMKMQNVFKQNKPIEQVNLFTEKIRSDQFEKLYNKLQKQANPTKMKQNFRRWKPLSFKQIQNLQFILLTENQIQKLSTQQSFQLFIKYCSFWNPPKSLSILKKQKVSETLLKVLNKKNQSFQNKHQFNRYCPRSPEAFKQYRHLVQVYGIMLNYCIETEFNEFIEINLPSILKDSIILGFQYFFFLNEILLFYFTELVKNRRKDLISALVYEFFQFALLTDFHFTPAFQQDLMKNINYRRICKFCSKYITDKLFQYFVTEVKPEEDYYRKLKILSFFWSAMMKNQGFKHNTNLFISQILQNQKDILNEINYQFSEVKIDQIQQASQFAQYYCYVFQKQYFHSRNEIQNQKKFNKFQINRKKGFDIEVLFTQSKQIYPQLIGKYLSDFDNKINCKFLSDSFFFVTRISDACYKQDKKQLLKLLNLITSNISYSQYNFQIIQNIKISSFFINLNYLFGAQYASFLLQYKQIYLKLNQIFRHIVQKIAWNLQLQKICLISWIRMTKCLQNKMLQCNDPQNELLLRQMMNRPQQKRFQFHFLCLLFQKQSFYSIEYLKTRKIIYQKMLAILKCKEKIITKRRQIILYDQVQYDCLDLRQINRLIRQQLYKNKFWFKQCLLFWQNHRIRIELDQNPEVNIEFRLLIEAFIRYKATKYIVQIISALCKQRNILKDGYSAFKTIYNSFLYIASHQQLHEGLYLHLYQHINLIKTNRFDPVKMIPLYLFALLLEPVLKKNIKIWKYLLIELYVTFQQVLEKNQFQIERFNSYREFICVASIKYLQAVKPNRRKINIWMRQLARYHNNNTKQRHFYVVEYIQKLNKMLNLNGHAMKYCSKNFMTNQNDQNESQDIRTKLISQDHRKLIKMQQKLYAFQSKIIGKEELQTILKSNVKQLKKVQIQKPEEISDTFMNTQKCHIYIMNRYKIRDLMLFERNKIVQPYMELLQTYQGKLSQQKDQLLAELEAKIQLVKKSQEFQICQSTVQLFEQILKVQKQQLQAQLKQQECAIYSTTDRFTQSLYFKKIHSIGQS